MTLATKTLDFNPHDFLSSIGKGREMLSLAKKSTIFAQGESTDGLFFIQKGKVQLTVVSEGTRQRHTEDRFAANALRLAPLFF